MDEQRATSEAAKNLADSFAVESLGCLFISLLWAGGREQYHSFIFGMLAPVVMWIPDRHWDLGFCAIKIIYFLGIWMGVRGFIICPKEDREFLCKLSLVLSVILIVLPVLLFGYLMMLRYGNLNRFF